MTQTQGVSTAYYRTMMVKPFVSWLRGERISDEEADALTTRPPSRLPNPEHLVLPHAWEAIIQQCHRMHERYSPVRHLRSYAALMTLRYCGMRITRHLLNSHVRLDSKPFLKVVGDAIPPALMVGAVESGKLLKVQLTPALDGEAST